MNGEDLDSNYTKDQIITNVKVSHDKIVRVNTNRVCKNNINILLELKFR